MTKQEINDALIKMRKNPHIVEKYSKEDLYDMMAFLQEKHQEDSLFMSKVYSLNKKKLVRKNVTLNKKLIKEGANKDVLKEMTIDRFVNDRPIVRERKKLYEMIEKQYDSLMEPNKENPVIDEEPDHTKFNMGQKFYLLDKLGLFDSTAPFNKKISLVKDKQKVVEKILGCNNRTAKGLLNGEEKYMPSLENIKQVESFLNKVVTQ